MKLHNVTQGSAEWNALRARCHTASEAPAMMGASKYKTRTALLAQKSTGISEEISEAKQALFNRGHETEAAARPLVEAMIGEELFPATATDDDEYLLASSDGATMLGTIGLEHKLWNKKLAAKVRSGELEPHYYWQLEQQALVFGFEKIIFVTSDGTANNFESMEYIPVPGRAEQLIAGWKQFDEDVANYQPEVIEAKPILHANPIDNLPALIIEVTGRVTHSNLVEFKAAATAVISSIKTELVSDQDFVDATNAVKYLKDVEDSAKRAKQNALDQTTSIAELHRALDEVATMAATVRKALDKKVTEEKDARKGEIVIAASREFGSHCAALGHRVGVPVALAVSFADAIKGLKSLDSMKDKVSAALANAKIDANAIADRIDGNRKAMGEYGFLFPDFTTVCTKAADDFAALLAARQASHAAAESARIEKIRAEEKAKAEAAAAAKVAEEARAAKAEADAKAAAERAEANRIAAEEMRKLDAQRKEEAAQKQVAETIVIEPDAKMVVVDTKREEPIKQSNCEAAAFRLNLQIREHLNSMNAFQLTDVLAYCESIIIKANIGIAA